MKRPITCFSSGPDQAPGRSRQDLHARGFTLTEVVVATAVFALVMAGVLTLSLFSARVSSGLNRLLELHERARVLNDFAREVRSAQSAVVQTYNGTTFNSVPLGQPQQGNALYVQIPNGSNIVQVRYWVDSGGRLIRWNVTANTSRIHLNDITNSIAFSARNFQGGIISNQVARTLIQAEFHVLDSNTRDFRQALVLRTAAEKRN